MTDSEANAAVLRALLVRYDPPDHPPLDDDVIVDHARLLEEGALQRARLP
jgi:hypothetical protein